MKTKDLVKASLIGVLTLVAGYIQVPLGPVPVTMQTLVVNVTAIILAPIPALVAMVLHLVLKLLISGAQYVFMPSFGFVVGFAIAALIGSLVYKKIGPGKKAMVLSIIITALVPYIVGLPYMAYILNGVKGAGMSPMAIMKAGFFIFIPGDILKIVLAYIISSRLVRAIGRS